MLNLKKQIQTENSCNREQAFSISPMKLTTILVIEDDESMRDTIETLLKKEYRIIKAVDGREALKELKEEEFQIALIDIKLPDIRGTEILKTIKRESLAKG